MDRSVPTFPTTASSSMSTSAAEEGDVIQGNSSDKLHASSTPLEPPSCLFWVEWPFRIRNPKSDPPNVINDEATAWAMDASARGPMTSSGSFVGVAILRLASLEASCATRKQQSSCSGLVYGIRPSSLLTVSSVAVGLVSAFVLPLVGAVVDHTPHRRAFGLSTATLLVLITGAQAMISQKTWFLVLLLETLGGFVMNLHGTTVLSYLPDLTTNQDALTVYTARFQISRSSFLFFYLLLVSVSSMVLKVDSTVTAKVAAGLACGFAFLLCGYSWLFLFKNRAPFQVVPEGRSLWSNGVYQVGHTTKKIWLQYPELMWFMIALLVSPESGSGVYTTIGVTYLTVVLKLTGAQIGFVLITIVAFNVLGSKISQFITFRYNALQSFRACLLFFSVNFLLTSIVASGPDRKYFIYICAAGWGVAFGWISPAQRVLYCTLSPAGQDLEIMGFFQFFQQILGWLPPLVFSIMNEAGIDMRLSMCFTAFYPFVAFLCLLPIRSYSEASRRLTCDDENNG